MKFGGTSVADAERVKRAARRIVDKREEGQQVVAVLSARGKTTDELIAMAEEVSPAPDPREMDMLLSSGERISCALCAMAINDLGHRAISLTGSQAGIVTDESHTKALILDVRADRIRAALKEDHIVLVAGFQGVSQDAAQRHHARARRLGHQRRRRRRRARRRRVRNLHGRARRVLGRPADRARRAQARHGVVRGDARDVRIRRRRAAAALRRVRSQPRRAHPLPLVVRRPSRYGRGVGRRDHGPCRETPHHRRHAVDLRCDDHAQGRAAQAGRRREPLRGAWHRPP